MKTSKQIQSINSYVYIVFSALFLIPTTTFGQAGEYTWCDVRNTISSIAIEQAEIWAASEESDPDMHINLVRYYAQIPMVLDDSPMLPKYQRVDIDNLAVKAANNKSAWGAAFICYVMRQAGITEEHGFEFSRRNLTYIVQALRNRYYHSTDESKVFWFFNIDEHTAQLEVGDIVCMNRKRKNGNLTNHSFYSLLEKYPKGTSLEEAKDVANCAIVASIYELPDGTVYAAIISGNKNNKVEVTKVKLENGLVKDPDQFNIFGVIKLNECNKYF